MRTEDTLLVKDLTKIYNSSFKAVDGISFSLGKGEILGLVGPNGSGKTTTIQMLLGTLSSSSGEIHYFGKSFELHRSEVLQYVSFASTYNSLPFLLTVQENLEIYGRFYGFNPKETSKRTLPLLERFGIADKLNVRLASLSAGQVTRLMIVKAFFTDPKIVLLDEPTASLDPDIALDVCEFIAQKRNDLGVSILFTSHKMEEVSMICDRAVFLKQGKIIANDLPMNLAKSVSSHRLSFSILEGLDKAISLSEQMNLKPKIDLKTFEISLDEKQIPSFLNQLVQLGITYSNIRIEEPTLDDFFLKISGKQ
jgi:ABC-2 type transport system ATP-binding protein